MILELRRWSDNTTFEASATHSLPTPITAWIPWASLSAPRGPVFIDVWTISSRSLGKFCILSATISSFSIHSNTWIIWPSKTEKKVSKNTLAWHTIKKRKYHLITQSMKFVRRDKQSIPPFQQKECSHPQQQPYCSNTSGAASVELQELSKAQN